MGREARSRKRVRVKLLSVLQIFKPNLELQNNLEYDLWIVRLIRHLRRYSHAFLFVLYFLPADTKKPVLMLSQELIMKTAKLFYKSQDYKLKANAESYKENVTNIYAQGRIRPKIQNLNRMREYFNVFIANHSAGMPKIGHFYNENSSNNFREIKIRIR